MDSVEITSVIIDKLEKVLDLGFNRLYVNVDDLENGIITEEDLFKKDYVIVKHGMYRDKQRYVLKSPEGKQLKHSCDIKKLEALKEKYERGDL